MQKSSLLLAVVLFAGCVSPGGGTGPAPTPTPIPNPSPGPVIDADIQAATAQFSTLIQQRPDMAADLAAFYTAFADVVASDSGVIKTTGQVRAAIAHAGQLAFGTKYAGAITGLAQAADNVIRVAVGDKDVPLGANKGRLVMALRALSQASGG